MKDTFFQRYENVLKTMCSINTHRHSHKMGKNENFFFFFSSLLFQAERHLNKGRDAGTFVSKVPFPNGFPCASFPGELNR